MKEGYKEEFRYFCLTLSLIIIFASPDLVSLMIDSLPLRNSQLAPIACYAAFLASVYSFGVTLDTVIPYPAKEWLIYPTINGKGLLRPGCKVFSLIGNDKFHDSRFRNKDACIHYSVQIESCEKMSAKESAVYQNSNWYQLYRTHYDLGSVKSNNIGYLYSRDASVLSFAVFALSLTISILCWFFIGIWMIGVWAIVCLLILAVICSFSARAKAKRLVATVIACDLASDQEKELYNEYD